MCHFCFRCKWGCCSMSVYSVTVGSVDQRLGGQPCHPVFLPHWTFRGQGSLVMESVEVSLPGTGQGGKGWWVDSEGPLVEKVSFMDMETLFVLWLHLCPEQCLLVEGMNQFRWISRSHSSGWNCHERKEGTCGQKCGECLHLSVRRRGEDQEEWPERWESENTKSEMLQCTGL